MKIKPHDGRKNIIFDTTQNSMGFFTCALVALACSVSLSGYLSEILLPEVRGTVITVFAFLSVALVCGLYLHSAEILGYSAVGTLIAAAGILNAPNIIAALDEKLRLISVQIVKYEPNYELPYSVVKDFGGGLTVAAVIITIVLSVIITHFTLRAKTIIPIILQTAVAFGVFVALEKTDSPYFYVNAICILALVMLEVQSRAAAHMGVALPVTRMGTKTLAFTLALLLVFIPVAGNEQFSLSVMKAVSELTGIKRPGVNIIGGYGEASGEVSGENFEQLFNDLEERQQKTEIEDISYQEIVLYAVTGVADDCDMYFRRKVYTIYSDSTWQRMPSFSSSESDLGDDYMHALLQKDIFSGSPLVQWANSNIAVAQYFRGSPYPIPVGTTQIYGETTLQLDTDGDDVPENLLAVRMDVTYPFIESSEQWYELLAAYPQNIYYGEITDPFAADGTLLSGFRVSGDELLDKELRYLAENILRTYGGFNSYEEWRTSESPQVSAAMAVQEYLTETKFYTMNPQKSDNYIYYDHDVDAIYNFLFNTGEGYCVQFASSACLLLKSLGVDTRYASGYVSRSANGDGIRELKDSDSHAWCEISIPGLGFFPVEMTYSAMIESVGKEGGAVERPQYSVPKRDDVSVPDESSDAPQESSEEISEQVSEEISEVSENISDVSNPFERPPVKTEWIVPFLIFTGTAALLICAVLLIRYFAVKRRKKMLEFRRSCAAGAKEPEKALLYLHTQHIKLMSMLGYKPDETELYSDYIARILRTAEMPNPKYAMEIFRKAEFGGKPDKADLVTAATHILQLNDYVYNETSGIKRRLALFKGLLTYPKKEEKK